MGFECGKRLGQRGGSTNLQAATCGSDLAQHGHARHVQHGGETLVLFGDPQPHIGAARHQLRFRVRGAQLEQFGQSLWQFISRIGLLRMSGGRKQLQF